jgi:hypothetical protein
MLNQDAHDTSNTACALPEINDIPHAVHFTQDIITSLRNWKKYFFLAYNRDFSHEIPPLIFAPPSARRNFFKCAPHNLKSWIRPCI